MRIYLLIKHIAKTLVIQPNLRFIYTLRPNILILIFLLPIFGYALVAAEQDIQKAKVPDYFSPSSVAGVLAAAISRDAGLKPTDTTRNTASQLAKAETWDDIARMKTALLTIKAGLPSEHPLNLPLALLFSQQEEKFKLQLTFVSLLKMQTDAAIGRLGRTNEFTVKEALEVAKSIQTTLRSYDRVAGNSETDVRVLALIQTPRGLLSNDLQLLLGTWGIEDKNGGWVVRALHEGSNLPPNVQDLKVSNPIFRIINKPK